ncbi:right-handed parallel beta-helix repeat-containing protein [Hymenobacter sp.]|uniref:right-handed parallel beta-helix repeat-containing protein n=1 Tax=Hymenobacter sp. TaxID=1898978 RepID=UPI00286A59B7|nr:right-handed parallel beta-helix repeat-containing protein [Hymenobacter sp.]
MKLSGACLLGGLLLLSLVDRPDLAALAGQMQGPNRPEKNIVSVAKFGAKANDGKNDLVAIRQALAACKPENSTLYFPKGRYDLFVDTDSSASIFRLVGLRKFTLEGNGAELLFHYPPAYLRRKRPDLVFDVRSVQGLTLRNFSIDYQRPSFSVGTVVKTAENSFDVAIRPQFPVQGGELVGAYMDYDAQTETPIGRIDSYNTVERTELIAPQVLRLHEKTKPTQPLKVGTLLVVRHHVYGGDAFYIANSANVVLEGVAVRTAAGMGFVSRNNTNVTLERFNILPGKGRIMSTTADGLNLGHCGGRLKINNCAIAGLGDDGINLHVDRFFRVVKKVDDQTILVDIKNHEAKTMPGAGDSVEFYNPASMVRVASMKVEYATNKSPYDRKFLLRFTTALPARVAESYALATTSRLSSASITNSTFRNIRARGIIIKEQNVTIENCTVENTTQLGIWVGAEHHIFFESYPSRNVLVRNNNIRNCGLYSEKKPGRRSVPGALCAYVRLEGDKAAEVPGSLRNITFENNKVSGAQSSGIFVAGVDGLTLQGNSVENACQTGTLPSETAAIYLQGCANVKLDDNTIPADKQGGQFAETTRFGNGNPRQ